MPIPQNLDFYLQQDLTPQQFATSPARVYFSDYSQYLAEKAAARYRTSASAAGTAGLRFSVPGGGTQYISYQGGTTSKIPPLDFHTRTDIRGNIIPDITGAGIRRSLGGGVAIPEQPINVQAEYIGVKPGTSLEEQQRQLSLTPEERYYESKGGLAVRKQTVAEQRAAALTEQGQQRIAQSQQRINQAAKKWDARYADMEKKFGYQKALQELKAETTMKLAKFQSEFRVDMQEDQQAFNKALDEVHRSDNIDAQRRSLANAITLINEHAKVATTAYERKHLDDAADELLEREAEFEMWQRKERERGERQVNVEVAKQNIMPKDAFILKFTEAQGRPPTETEIEKAKGKYW